MSDLHAGSSAPEAPENETRKPFAHPALEDLGTMTIVTQQTIVIPP